MAAESSWQVDDFYLRLLTRGGARPVEIGAPENDPVAAILKGVTDKLLEFVASTVDDPELAPLFRADNVLVRMIPPAGIQALTLWISPRHAIAVNRGLTLFLYRLARAFSAHVIIRSPKDPPAPPESETVGIIASLLDWMGSLVRAPLFQDFETGPREIQTADNYTRAAERFVLAHELGHILNRHVIANAGDVGAGRVSLVGLDTRPVEQEIEADVTGQLLTIESLVGEGIDPRAGVAGVHFFLQALGLCETVGAVVVDETHLPAAERLAVCDFALDQRYKGDAAALLVWATQTDDLLARLASAALDQRTRRGQAASVRMQEVFATTPWPSGRRDKALLDEMLTLMFLAPSAVVDALDANLLDAAEYHRVVAAAASREELERDDSWRRHQIAHFISRKTPTQVQHALGVSWPTFAG